MRLTSSTPVTTTTPRTLESRAELTRGGCVKPDLHCQPWPRPGGDRQARTQGNHLERIADGLRDGSITQDEAQKLLKQQEAIAKATQAAKADGIVTRAEAAQLAAMQRKASRDIFQAENNCQHNPFAAFDGTAQRQASQLDQIAQGRENGTITHREAGHLLRDQAAIAGAASGANGWLGQAMVDYLQDREQGDINYHSLPGTQPRWPDFNSLPGVRPLPEPLPLPGLFRNIVG